MLHDVKIFQKLKDEISTAYEYSYDVAKDAGFMTDAVKEYINACKQYHDAKELLEHIKFVISETADSMDYIGSKIDAETRLDIYRKNAK